MSEVFIFLLFIVKSIFMEFRDDIVSKKNLFVDDKEFERYLWDKYFNYLFILVLGYFFKNLWKFIFCLDNFDCDVNCGVNYCVMKIMMKNFRVDMLGLIINDKKYYLNIKEGVFVKYFIGLISLYLKIYWLFED